jgi:hypothetical protein
MELVRAVPMVVCLFTNVLTTQTALLTGVTMELAKATNPFALLKKAHLIVRSAVKRDNA